ncbi:MAG: TldD/PmbA family protein, partial [Candidatus Rokuibacteriota bacterium]
MPHGIETRLIETVAPMVRELVMAEARALADLRYADVRLEVGEGKFAGAENGLAKTSGDDYAFAVGIRVLAGRRMTAPGYFGRGLGAADLPHLARLLREGLRAAYRRAVANAEMKAEVKGKLGALGDSLSDTRLHPIQVRQEVVPAIFEVDPRGVALDDMQRLTTDVSRRVKDVHSRVSYNYVSTMTQLSRELFASSEGALIDQSFALTQGMCYVVATGPDNSQE